MKIPDEIKVGASVPRPKDVEELPSRRSLHTKVFTKNNGQFSLVASRTPVHYKKEDGSLDEIDLSFLKGKGQLRGTHYCETAPYKIYVKEDTVGYSYVSRVSGEFEVELVSFDNKPVPKVKGVAKGNLITWSLDGVDFVCALKPNGVELFKIVHSAASPNTWTWRMKEAKGAITFANKTLGVDAEDNATQVLTERTEFGDYFEYKETVTKKVSRLSDYPGVLKIRQREWTDDPVYPLLIDVEVVEDVAATTDDGFERSSAWYTAPYSTYSCNIWGFPSQLYNGGIRFQTIAVPQGATIDSAILSLNVVSSTGSPSLRIYGDDVDDAAVWGSSSRPSQITQTTASTLWNNSGTGAKTVDITTIVQEIVNRGGWSSGNDMRFGLIDQVGSGNNNVCVSDFKAGASLDPFLTINYTVGGGSANKTVKGLAIASVKTINGLAIASVKTIKGLA